MMPDELDSKLLYVFVCGPGQGESIAIRVPENEWIVIDSCRTSGKVFATHVLRKYGGHKCCLVLTHRHRDHYRGFSDLVEMEEWSFLGCNDRTLGPAGETHDAEEKLTRELDQVFSTFRRRWNESEEAKWLTWRGSERQIGDARLLTLHPDQEFAQSYQNSSEKKQRRKCFVISHDVAVEGQQHLAGRRYAQSILGGDREALWRWFGYRQPCLLQDSSPWLCRIYCLLCVER